MQKLDPKAVWLFFLQNLFGIFILLISLIFLSTLMLGTAKESDDIVGVLEWIVYRSESSFWFLAFVFLILWIILSYVFAKLTYHFYKYELREDGFKKEYGIIWKKYVTIPYDRIQNVDIYRGILARILGLSDIHIQTAGMSAVVTRYGAYGAGAEGRLPGLSKEVAEQIRDELVHRTRGYQNHGL